jgi:hypothetical protein
LVAGGFSVPRCGRFGCLGRTTSEIMPWAFPRKVYRGERLANHDYRSARPSAPGEAMSDRRTLNALTGQSMLD